MRGRRADVSRGFFPEKVMQTVIRGDFTDEALDAIVAILTSRDLTQEQMEWGISQLPNISQEAAMILLQKWFDGGRWKAQWQVSELKKWIKVQLITKLGAAMKDRVERIAESMSRKAAMANTFATSPDGMIELLLDVTSGFLQVGMGGEWWNGPVKPGRTILHHRKESVDPAYRPVEVVVGQKGYQVQIQVSGGFGFAHTFIVGLK